MNYEDIKRAIDVLNEQNIELDRIYTESEGEVTEEAEAMEKEKEAVATLLEGEGIDYLGRWLKGKEDELATYKDEKAACDRRIKATKNTIDFIKIKIGEVLRLTGREKVKGTYYTFSQFNSVSTSFDARALDEEYLDMVTEAVRNAGLPSCIDVALKTTATRLQADEDHARFVSTETTPTSKFTKPKKTEE